MKYELTLSGSFENRTILNLNYEEATEVAERLVEELKSALKHDGFENIDVRFQIDELPEGKS